MHAKKKQLTITAWPPQPQGAASTGKKEDTKVRKSHTFKLEEKNCCVYNSRTHAHTSTQEDTDEVQCLKLQSVV